MNKVIFSGPTLFAPIIRTAGKIAASMRCAQTNQKYAILLILTDGEITDMDATKAAIAEVSNQPLSIIVIGVGNENFDNMKVLDDTVPNCARDIVQFIP